MASDATPLGLKTTVGRLTQGSSFLASLGFVTQSRWDWGIAAIAARSAVFSVCDSLDSFLASEGFRFVAAYSFHNSRFGMWIRVSPAPPLRAFCLSRTIGQAG